MLMLSLMGPFDFHFDICSSLGLTRHIKHVTYLTVNTPLFNFFLNSTGMLKLSQCVWEITNQIHHCSDLEEE